MSPKPRSVRLESPGIYLFSAPVQAQISIYRETVVILWVAAKKSAGIAILSPESKVEDLRQTLDGLHHKVTQDLGLKDPKIEVKIFGGSMGGKLALQTALHWVEVTTLPLLSRDTGGDHPRNLTVDCATGGVGITYADRTPAELFLTLGTARLRNPLDNVQTEVLVLSKNSVKRTLAKQAIEEQPQWSASTPKNPKEILGKTGKIDFPWSIVLLFDDLEEDAACLKWITKMSAQYPSVQFRWVGGSLPSFAKKVPFLKHLPPVEPVLMPEFKRKIQRALFEHLSSDTSDIIKFPKRRRAR
jgi:hypothetical protein